MDILSFRANLTNGPLVIDEIPIVAKGALISRLLPNPKERAKRANLVSRLCVAKVYCP